MNKIKEYSKEFKNNVFSAMKKFSILNNVKQDDNIAILKNIAVSNLYEKIYFIGDIHGKLDNNDIENLLKNKSELKIFLGDLLDRADTEEEIFNLLNKFTEIIDRNDVIIIKGNHENHNIENLENFYELIKTVIKNETEIKDVNTEYEKIKKLEKEKNPRNKLVEKLKNYYDNIGMLNKEIGILLSDLKKTGKIQFKNIENLKIANYLEEIKKELTDYSKFISKYNETKERVEELEKPIKGLEKMRKNLDQISKRTIESLINHDLKLKEEELENKSYLKKYIELIKKLIPGLNLTINNNHYLITHAPFNPLELPEKIKNNIIELDEKTGKYKLKEKIELPLNLSTDGIYIDNATNNENKSQLKKEHHSSDSIHKMFEEMNGKFTENTKFISGHAGENLNIYKNLNVINLNDYNYDVKIKSVSSDLELEGKQQIKIVGINTQTGELEEKIIEKPKTNFSIPFKTEFLKNYLINYFIKNKENLKNIFNNLENEKLLKKLKIKDYENIEEVIEKLKNQKSYSNLLGLIRELVEKEQIQLNNENINKFSLEM